MQDKLLQFYINECIGLVSYKRLLNDFTLHNIILIRTDRNTAQLKMLIKPVLDLESWNRRWDCKMKIQPLRVHGIDVQKLQLAFFYITSLLFPSIYMYKSHKTYLHAPSAKTIHELTNTWPAYMCFDVSYNHKCFVFILNFALSRQE